MSTIYRFSKDYDNALEFAKNALVTKEKILNKNHHSLGTSYNNISLIYQDLGKLKEALYYSNKAFYNYEEILNKNHPFLATVYNNIAYIYADLKECKKQKIICKKLKIFIRYMNIKRVKQLMQIDL